MNSEREGRELLIRQIAEEPTIAERCPDLETRRWLIAAVLVAQEAAGFEVIPASTLEADRRVLDAAEEETAAEDAAVALYGAPRQGGKSSAFERMNRAQQERRAAVRARRGVSDD